MGVMKHKRRASPILRSAFALCGLFVVLGAVTLKNYILPSVQAPIQSSIATISDSVGLVGVSPFQLLQEPTNLFEEEEIPCENISDQADKCLFVTENCSDVAAILDYLKFRYCTLGSFGAVGASIVSVLVMAFLIALLISLLGSTADVFFVPALSVVSIELNLSPTVAGITFLALGNGAPDVFTAMAGAAADDFPMVLGALIGAGVCISCCVLGSVISVGNTVAPKKAFWRDITMYAVCMITTVIVCASGRIRMFEAMIFIAMYLSYVTAVVFYVQCKRCARARKEALARLTSRSEQRSDAIQPLLVGDEQNSSNQFDDLPQKTDTIEPSEAPAEEEDDVDQTYFMEGVSFPHPSWEGSSKPVHIFYVAQYFVELPFSFSRWLTIPSTHVRPDKLVGAKLYFALLSPLFSSVLLFISAYGLEFDLALQKDGSFPTIVLFILIGAILTCCLGLFYKTLFTRSALRLKIAEDLRQEVVQSLQSSQDDKVTTSINITSASQDAPVHSYGLEADSLLQMDSKSLEALQEEVTVPTPVKAMGLIFALIAFISSVGWLNLIANELVAVLQTIGLMFNISTTILGLTVLAIGNSVPDWISNTAVARAGSPQTAMASIFGAPLLTTLCGLGISLSVACWKQYPEPFTFEVTKQVIITWVGVLASTALHMVVFPLFNYSPPAKYSYVLFAFYGTFILTIILFEAKIF